MTTSTVSHGALSPSFPRLAQYLVVRLRSHACIHASLELPPVQARQLLKEASDGVNPFEGFTPKLADGESLVFGTEEFDMMEAEGLRAAAKTGFVLVRKSG